MADYTELAKKLRVLSTSPWIDGEPIQKAADAIEELQKSVEFANALAKCWEELAQERKTMFDRLLSVRPRWIPVAERLPEEHGLYLVFVKHEAVQWGDEEIPQADWTQITHFWGGKFYLKGNTLGAAVTHWMPLPEPPKEET